MKPLYDNQKHYRNFNAIPSTIVIDSKGYVAARVSGVVTIGSLSALIEKVQGK
jgi:hypothetical protein